MKTVGLIEIGFSNNIFDNPCDVVASVQTMSSEFKAIEIEIAEAAQESILRSSPQQYMSMINCLNILATERKLTYSVHAPWFGEGTDALSPDSTEQSSTMACLSQSLEFAVDINANILVFHPGKSHGRSSADSATLLVNNLHDFSNQCSLLGVQLCLENMGADRPAHAVFSSAELAQICELTGIRLCLDIPHLASVSKTEGQLIEDAAALARYVSHIHIGDTGMPDHRHMPIGEGNIPLCDVLHTLASNGVTGHAIVEEYNRPYTAKEYWKAALVFRDALQP